MYVKRLALEKRMSVYFFLKYCICNNNTIKMISATIIMIWIWFQNVHLENNILGIY